ncbi:MAG: hypothetical protein N2Z20_02730 [Elusimicrobiales bacterium]|nr:hypothetical protein [Elusimicrobiales bacterium]
MILSIIIFFNSIILSQSKTYLEITNELSWEIWGTVQTKKELQKYIEEQVANLDTLNKIRQAQIKLREMAQRQNIKTAVKIVDVGITAVGIITGGTAIAAKEGGKEALKWYFAKEVGKEVTKEAIGIPGYSDIIGAGVFIFNKADENTIRAQLSKESSQILIKVQEILKNSETSYQDKSREMFNLTLEMEEIVETKQNQIKGIANLLEEKNKKIEELRKIAQILKDEEKKKESMREKNIKNIEYKPEIETQTNKDIEIEIQTLPNETKEESRKKMQKAIDNYINSLSLKIVKDDDKVCKELRNIKNQDINYGYDAESYWKEFEYMKKNLDNLNTYSSAESMEISAKNIYENLIKQKDAYKKFKVEIKNNIEPLIKNMLENISLWNKIYLKYTSAGYKVAKPPENSEFFGYKNCYINEMSNIESFMASTNGLENLLSSIETSAKGRKELIYKIASDFGINLVSKIEDFKSKKPIYEKIITEKLSKLDYDADKIISLRQSIINEFSSIGSKNLKNLSSKISEASLIYSDIVSKYLEINQKYKEINTLAYEINEMKSNPLISDISYISYQSKNQSHKSAMLPLYKKIQDDISLNIPYYDFEDKYEIFSKNITSAQTALNYLESQKNKIISIYSKAISDFKTASQKDFSSFYESTSTLKEEVLKLDCFYEDTKKQEEEITSEIVSKKFFENVGEQEPTLARTGFNDKEILNKKEEFEKLRSDFWSSDKGKEIKKLLSLNNNISNDLQTIDKIKNNYINKLYNDLKNGYETKNIYKIISLIDPSWQSPDGDTISQLQEHLTNIFKVFNEIKFNITNLHIIPNKDGSFRVNYNLEIISKIYSKNIKRIENSFVSEMIIIENGKARIVKTEEGNYWMIK